MPDLMCYICVHYLLDDVSVVYIIMCSMIIHKNQYM